MIDEIQVSNLALIRQVSLEPCRGLTVVTGETGSGKTALLSALKLLMGARASADLVRDGQGELSVSGRFFGLAPSVDAPSPGSAEVPDEDVVVRRVSVDGRSRATINGAMASVGELAALVAPSIDLCGQLEHQRLMKPANHVGMLDAWAGVEVAQARRAYEEAFKAAAEAAGELARLREIGQMSSARLDEARFALRRIDEVDPQPGEYEQLSKELQLVEHAESLVSATSSAHEALSGDEGALDALSSATMALDAAGRVDPVLADLAQSLREAGYVLEDVAAQVRAYRDEIDFDPVELAAQQERFSQMQGLLRSFGPRMEDVFEARSRAADVVSAIDDSSQRMQAAQRAVQEAEAVLADTAEALDAARGAAMPRFAQAVGAVMDRLEMGGAALECASTRLDRGSWTISGPSSFEFMYRPGRGMQARPLARIASGGEISRVMLAIKVVLGANDDVDTLVFDEVDAGVGGSVALALADVIADLAQSHQVIVVTHLAQVAVRGQAHYVVSRAEQASGTETQLCRVEAEERESEIARMLSGSVTETSLAHARELLHDSQKKS